MANQLDAHYEMVVKAITQGQVIPFLGAGVNVCGRPKGVAWRRGEYLPSGRELAEYLGSEFAYPPKAIDCPVCGHPIQPGEKTRDLLRVAQYAALMLGSNDLYRKLREVFNDDYPPTPVHQFLATLPGILRKKGYSSRYQLIVTTNYDDVLERAFMAVGEPFDLVAYMAGGDHQGKFVHRSNDGEVYAIERPDEYRNLPLDPLGLKRTIILKIHGAIDRTAPEGDSFVVTEDDYIDYVAQGDVPNPLPRMLSAIMRYRHFLFLGYGLGDWNLRVILRRIWDERKRTSKSWAIQLQPQPIDLEFWRQHDVVILDVPLEDYMASLKARLDELRPAEESLGAAASRP
jgi:hypothetical protein